MYNFNYGEIGHGTVLQEAPAREPVPIGLASRLIVGSHRPRWRVEGFAGFSELFLAEMLFHFASRDPLED